MSDPNPAPSNNLVTPLLTDLYQITMAYAYWKTGQHRRPAHFELFFRKNPFGGSFTIFAGLDEVLKLLASFRFSESDLTYLRGTEQLKHCSPAFFDEYLANLDCSEVVVHALREGSLAFPRVPLLTVTAPLGIGNLLETTLLTLINFPSLVATNACRMIVAARGQLPAEPAGSDASGTPAARRRPKCVEFGLRRAQGPDGGFSASKYAHVGGFDATSNVLAGKLLGVPISGTHAHSFVMSHTSLQSAEGLRVTSLKGGGDVELLPLVLKYRRDHGWGETNDGELAAFTGYAYAFPDACLCLIDTYDTLRSGLRNFILVALALDDLGHTPRGIRLDSGDLSVLSLECERVFRETGDRLGRPFFRELDIVASNDINEAVLHSLGEKGHGVTVFGIGTNLVTCQAQPALGCVYKLVEVDGAPRIKLSNDLEKVLIPGRKTAYRLFGEQGWPLLDLLTGADEPPLEAGRRTLCLHPFAEQERVAVVPTRVVRLHGLAFDGARGVVAPRHALGDTRRFVREQVEGARADLFRYVNPRAYKVSVSEETFSFLHEMWKAEAPIKELR